MKNIKLIALDMDGTLLDSSLKISEENQKMIKEACAQGVEVVISTGRPYIGIPTELLAGLGVKYAITSNGAALYKLPEKECLFEDCIPLDEFLPIARKIQSCDVFFHVFINGISYFEEGKRSVVDKMKLSDTHKKFFHNSGYPVEDIVAFIEEQNVDIEKAGANFYPLSEDIYKDYDELEAYLRNHPSLTTVCGGFHNLEFAHKGLSKATGLKFLADYLHISMEEVMAVGDSENDIDIIEAAGIGVAMENAEPIVKEACDFVTLSNDEDGVAYAIRQFVKLK